MPLVKVNMLEGKTPEFKKTVFDCIHEGLIDSFGIADWDRFQRIEEFDKSCWEAPEKLGIPATDVFIVMNEPPLENWGMGGNQK